MVWRSRLRVLGEVRDRLLFDNKNFWNDRYRTNMDKGSGPGSRGEQLELKNKIIQDLINKEGIRSVLDIGCGDIEILNGIEIPKYTGIDISEIVTARNRELRPQWEFLCVDVGSTYEPEPADLVLCLDVLIHQKRRTAYDAIVTKAIRSAKM